MCRLTTFALSMPLALLSQLFGCAVDRGSPGDGGRGDGSVRDSGICERGQWYCVNGGLVARQCDGRGGYAAEDDCQSRRLTCFAGPGCRVCERGSRRCDPDRPQQTQECNDDGSGWSDGAACDGTAGLTCTVTAPKSLSAESFPRPAASR